MAEHERCLRLRDAVYVCPRRPVRRRDVHNAHSVIFAAEPPPLPPPPLVLRMGVGLGPIRIGARRVLFGERFRTERHSRNDRGGCSGWPPLDSFVDYYDGRRLGYVFSAAGGTFLDTIATTRIGDRTAVGFAIGREVLAQVRRRYPHARTLHEHGRYFLGATQLRVSVTTGDETWKSVTYSFDGRGRLIELETAVGGC